MFGCERFGYQDFTEMCTHNAAHPIFGAVFFISFMLLGSMVILNLFIGVITSGMEEAKAENGMLDRELKDAEGVKQSASDDVSRMLVKIGELQDELRVLEHRLRSEAEEGAEAAKA
jgi:voltage-gated sodium channel